MSDSAPLRIILVDDHEIVRRGLRAVLSEPDIEIVGEAGTMHDGVALALKTKPGVVVMDLRLPDGSGIEACREIRAGMPDARVLILTSYADEDALFSAVMAGASGYVLKDLDPARLKEAIRTVGAGGSLLEDAPVHEMNLDVWHRTINLNLLHPFICCKYGIPHMMAGGGGSIINFSSQTGLTGSVRPAYAAAKGGIGSFTKTLAAQYAQFGIRANAIAPGSIQT